MLSGVGAEFAQLEVGNVSLQMRRFATDAEVERVGGVKDVRGTSYKPLVDGATW